MTIMVMNLTKLNGTLGFKIKHSIDNYSWDMEALCKSESSIKQ